jgi:hypothetical protein
MTSPAKKAANRRNAQKSTGPRTDAGKAKAKMNATTHGLRALSPVVLGEKEEEWQRFHEELLNELEPQGVLETLFADQAALLAWRMRRVHSYEAGMITQKAERAKSRLARETAAAEEQAMTQNRFLDSDRTETVTTIAMQIKTREQTMQEAIDLKRLFNKFLKTPLNTTYRGEDAMAILEKSWFCSLPEDYPLDTLDPDEEAEIPAPPGNSPANTDEANSVPSEASLKTQRDIDELLSKIGHSNPKSPPAHHRENFGKGHSPIQVPLNPDPDLTGVAAKRADLPSSGNVPPAKSPNTEVPTTDAAANGGVAKQPPATPENTNQGKASEPEPAQFTPIWNVRSGKFLQEIGVPGAVGPRKSSARASSGSRKVSAGTSRKSSHAWKKAPTMNAKQRESIFWCCERNWQSWNGFETSAKPTRSGKCWFRTSRRPERSSCTNRTFIGSSPRT